MGILEIVGIVFGSGGVGSLITWAISLRANRRIKEAEAGQSESTLESMKLANMHGNFDFMYDKLNKMMHDYTDISEEYRAYRQKAVADELAFQKKVDDKCSELASLKAQIQYLKGLRCYNTTCSSRIKLNPEKQK